MTIAGISNLQPVQGQSTACNLRGSHHTAKKVIKHRAPFDGILAGGVARHEAEAGLARLVKVEWQAALLDDSLHYTSAVEHALTPQLIKCWRTGYAC